MPPKKTTVIDITQRIRDAHKAEGVDDTLTPPTVEVRAFDQSFRVFKDVNLFNLIALDDPESTGALFQLVQNMLHPDDRKPFITAFAREHHMDGTAIRVLFESLLEAATGEIPTMPPSDSGRTTRPKAAIASSAGS